ncbi:hypothetical protein [Mycobacterium sp. 852002-50816_SCH5313054-b]|uniref:hypothetical protein n=1 Tax=Mycobacterium sp. 852002-50816_SCH5313054-b TaxID=1834092 RepID=UPI000AA563FF|nr:hypothetical protein [Mycobacterium sp. 852002-50816_SCH5313054-b]
MGSQDQHREIIVQQEQPKPWDQLYPTQELYSVGFNEIRGYGPTYARVNVEGDQGREQGDANL